MDLSLAVPHTTGNASARPFGGELIFRRQQVRGRDTKPAHKLSGNIHQDINVFPDNYSVRDPDKVSGGWYKLGLVTVSIEMNHDAVSLS
jgi:hypothetical protein